METLSTALIGNFLLPNGDVGAVISYILIEGREWGAIENVG